jgi:PPIC-type PPIASE domain
VRLLKEPLLHFLLLGAGIFGGYHILSGAGAAEPGEIVVTQGRIEALAAAFTRSWQRPPSPAEREGLIRDYIRDELYAREAIALGLDEDDLVIRRRLRQKLEFVSEDVATDADPTDEELRAHLTAHPEVFRLEPRFTFRQVFLDPGRRGERLTSDAARLLARLQRGETDPASAGDGVMLEREFDALPADVVAQQFGEQFAAELERLPSGQWQGPVASAYGVHLVLVVGRTEGRVPALEEVRDAVRREWMSAQRLEAREQYYQALLRRYTVTIEGAAPGIRELSQTSP